MYNYCFCPRLVIQCFLVQPMLNVGTVGLYIAFILVKDLLDFKCYFLTLCFKFQPISYVLLYNCHILLSCAKFFEFFQRWQQKMWGGGPETRIPTSLGGGAAWSGNDQNIAENGWLLPFFAGGDAGKWVKESGGHLPWSVLSPGPVPTLC